MYFNYVCQILNNEQPRFFSCFTSGSCSLSKYTKLCMVWQISVICCELSGGEKPHFTFFNKQTKYVLSFYRQQICQRQQRCVVRCCQRWHPVAPPGFLTGGSEVWVYRGSRVRSPPVPVVLSVYQPGSLLDGLAMYLSCDTKKFHYNESTHIIT